MTKTPPLQNPWQLLYDTKNRDIKELLNWRLIASKQDTDPIQSLLDNMIKIEGGTFMMGNQNYEWIEEEQEKGIIDRVLGRKGKTKKILKYDGPENEYPHEVTLDTFSMAKYPVTQAQWQAIMGDNPSNFKGDDQRPVERVSWNDAQEFIQKLNEKTGQNFRLPTEAEWEFAARGGNLSKGFEYAGGNNIEEVAWYEENSYDKGEKHPDYGTHPVGQKKPNELGLYDMSGNVFEWCQDWYDANYYKKSIRKNPMCLEGEKVSRVLRGGSWDSFTRYCRVANRYRSLPTYGSDVNGFRLAQ